VIAALLALPASAGAQPPPVTRPATSSGPAAAAANAANAAATNAATAPSALPTPPAVEVNDPMLTSVPPASKVLNNWKEALGFIMSRSTSLATAVQEVEKAEGNARVALAAALPSINGTVTITGQLITPPAGTSPLPNPLVSGALQVTQPVLAPRQWYAIRTAELGITSNKFAMEDQKRTIFAGVASSIITVFTAERTAEINRNGLKSALQVLDLTQRQFKLGTATRLDVLRAQQSAQTARATLVSGDEALRQAREALGLALGFQEAYGVPASLSLNEIEGTVRGVCQPGPLDERADIKKAHNDIEIARRGINDVWLQFSPTAVISSTLAISNTNAITSTSLSGHDTSWNLVGVLSIPFWEGGARYGNLRIARANHEEAKINLEAALRTANIQVTQALRGVSVSEQERVVSEQARDLARDLFKLTMSSYQLGTATNFDLVNTEQTWRAAELDLVVKEFTLIQSKLTAVLATSNCAY
jgi:multidrug efflux system outer membrane protein